LGPHLGIELRRGPIVITYSRLPCLEAARWGNFPEGLTPRRLNRYRGFHLHEPSLWAWPHLEAVEPPWPWSDANQPSDNFLPVPPWVRDEVEFDARLERDRTRMARRERRGDGGFWSGPKAPAPPPPWPGPFAWTPVAYHGRY
jgi:hypothetical protein